jgi:hypothetical protein
MIKNIRHYEQRLSEPTKRYGVGEYASADDHTEEETGTAGNHQ